MGQCRERGQIHDHSDVTTDVALPNSEVDIEKQHDVAGYRRRRQTKERRRITPEDFGQRHLQTPLKHVRDGRKATVKQDVAGLGQCLLLQFDDVFKRKIAARDGPYQLQALRFWKDQEGTAGNVAFEYLMNGDKIADFALRQNAYRLAAADQPDGRDREMDLLADHLPQAMRRAADADVYQFSQRVDL